MTVETTLQDMYDNFPDLFSTREECYDHLFCTNGNGYDWKWGQIVENVYGLKEDGKLHEDDYLHPKVLKAEQTLENIRKKQNEDRSFHDFHRQEMLEEEGIDIGEYNPKTHWYPLCKYSLIFNIPDDVRSDWKQAAIECFKMLEKDGVIDKLQKDYGNLIRKTVEKLGIKTDDVEKRELNRAINKNRLHKLGIIK